MYREKKEWEKGRKTYRLGSPLRLVRRNLLNGALYLDQIHGLRAQVDGRLGQDGLHFGQLVLVARDEVEFFGGSHCSVLFWFSDCDPEKWVSAFAGGGRWRSNLVVVCMLNMVVWDGMIQKI